MAPNSPLLLLHACGFPPVETRRRCWPSRILMGEGQNHGYLEEDKREQLLFCKMTLILSPEIIISIIIGFPLPHTYARTNHPTYLTKLPEMMSKNPDHSRPTNLMGEMKASAISLLNVSLTLLLSEIHFCPLCPLGQV